MTIASFAPVPLGGVSLFANTGPEPRVASDAQRSFLGTRLRGVRDNGAEKSSLREPVGRTEGHAALFRGRATTKCCRPDDNEIDCFDEPIGLPAGRRATPRIMPGSDRPGHHAPCCFRMMLSSVGFQ